MLYFRIGVVFVGDGGCRILLRGTVFLDETWDFVPTRGGGV